MLTTSISGGYSIIYLLGGWYISRLIEMRNGKKIFLQPKDFLLMRYKGGYFEDY